MPDTPTLPTPASSAIAPGPGSKRPGLLGEMLIASNRITRDQLEMALGEQRRTRAQLGTVLVRLNLVSEAAVAECVAQQEGLAFKRLTPEGLDPKILSLVPEALARRHQLIPIGRTAHALQVAMANPNDVIAVDAVRDAVRMPVERVVTPESDLAACFDRAYQGQEGFEAAFEKAIAAASWKGGEIDAAQVARGPIVELVDQLISRAIEERATDIHVQPEEGVVRVRLRVDGLLQSGPMIPKALQLPVSARLKVMAQLNLSESRLPQDGRIRFQHKNRQVDLRVSTFLTNFGENIVLRVLDRAASSLSLTRLGMLEEDLQRFTALLQKPHGIILVTGPTGSGKTTTLYAALSAINSVERNIMTVEDPIEYELPLVRQSQLNLRAGITFASGLRAILRQDPDVILIGEMRDEETAQMAVRAALTGHLVFSTLHTNTAAGAMVRLNDLGLSPLLLSNTIHAVMAQRLCRMLCPQCKAPGELPGRHRRAFAALARSGGFAPSQIFQAKGCGACRQTGYRGRVGLFELLEVTPRVRRLVADEQMGEDELSQEHRELGHSTLYTDGLRKIALGLTSFDELQRVIEAEAELAPESPEPAEAPRGDLPL